MRRFLPALGAAFLAFPAHAAVLHVPADYPTIQAALNAASSGDEVLVAAGTYVENLVMSPAQDGVLLHSESGPAVTIVDGGGVKPALFATGVGGTTEVIGFTFTNAGLDLSTNIGSGLHLRQASLKLQGNVIRNNVQTGGMYVDGGAPWILQNEVRDNQAPHGAGGGIYYDHFATGTTEHNLITNNFSIYRGGGIAVWEGSQPLIENNQIVTNRADDGGGGFLVTRGSSPTIRHNEIRGNETSLGSGGGLLIDLDSHPLIEDNQIMGNSGGAAAGAIYINGEAYGAHPTIRRNLIQDNQCPHGSGGGIYCDRGATPQIEENVIVRNHCVAWGGGVTAWEYSSALLRNNTIALNAADIGGGGIYVTRAGQLQMQNNIVSHSTGGGILLDHELSSITFSCNDVWGNGAYEYSGVPDPTGSGGNISQDPKYCDLVALDLHIRTTSPCAAANSPSGCNLIGALDVGCNGPVPTQVETWGRIKGRYR